MRVNSSIPPQVFQVGVKSAKAATRIIARFVESHPSATIAFEGKYETLPAHIREHLPSSRWTKVFPVHHYFTPSAPPDRVKDAARMKTAGEALGKDIYASLTKPSNAPGFVLMDELRRSNAGVIKAAAQYLAAQKPTVAGRWGTYVAHVASYKQYKNDGVLKALRDAGARVVVEEYPQRLMIEGITQKERDEFRSYVNAAGLKFLIKQGLDPTVVLGVYAEGSPGMSIAEFVVF